LGCGGLGLEGDDHRHAMEYLKQFEEKPDQLFGKLFWNIFFCLLPFNLIAAFLNLFEIIPVTINDEETYGIAGFITLILLIPFIAISLSAVVWIYYSIGNFFLRQFNKFS